MSTAEHLVVTSPGSRHLAAILNDVVAERDRQDAKWGEQNHPNVIEPPEAGMAAATYAALMHRLPTAQVAKDLTDRLAARGEVTWADIAVEEIAEAVEAAATGDLTSLRAELVQCAAVFIQWIAAHDRAVAAAAAADLLIDAAASTTAPAGVA